MSASPGRFAGRTAVVTGAAAGIGAATAQLLATEGASVVLADLDGDGAARLAGSLAATGSHAVAVTADVSQESGWDRIMAAADRLGPVSVLVSNAVRVEVAPAHATTPDSWHRQLDTALGAAFLGFRACLPGLRAERGAAVLVSSVHARHGIPGHPAYAAAKGGLLALAGQLAVEYGPDVRVNSVLPGPVLTRLWDRVPEADRRASAEQTAARRLGDPAEVAAAIGFLAGSESSFVTGTSLVVDGGWSVVKSSA